MSLGKYPEVPLSKARERLIQAKNQLANNNDPMQIRKEAKIEKQIAVEHSFQNIACKWLEHWRIGKSSRHADYVEKRLNADVFPMLGHRPIAEINAPEILRVVDAIKNCMKWATTTNTSNYNSPILRPFTAQCRLRRL